MSMDKYGNTDILTDKGNRAFALSSFDVAIPYCHSGELGEIMQRIKELSDELHRLTERANQIYAHGYVKISLNSDRSEEENS